MGHLAIYTISDTAILTIKKDYKKCPGTAIFLEDEILRIAYSNLDGFFAC